MKNADCLIFDEATSSLYLVSELSVFKQLYNNNDNKINIITNRFIWRGNCDTGKRRFVKLNVLILNKY